MIDPEKITEQKASVPKLSLQCESIAKNTITIRSLDWERSRFDIEFGLKNGTTYNSFIIKGEKNALIEGNLSATDFLRLIRLK